MPKQILVHLNSPQFKSALVDVPDSTDLGSWIIETKAKDFFISTTKQLWVFSAISGAEMIEAVISQTAVQAMQAMESTRRK